jgi:signal transduction histidine kinase/PAS domain-containing protein
VYQPLLGENGQVDGVMVLAVDVTPQVVARREADRARAEAERLALELQAAAASAASARDAALALEHERTAMLESITDLFFSFDHGWRVRYMNPRAAALLHALSLDPGSIIGHVIWDAIPQLRGTPFETETKRAVAENRTVQYQGYLHITDTWFRVRVYPAADQVTVYAQDITDRKRVGEDRQFLADVTARLTETALDYEATLAEVVRLATPHLADAAAVDLLTDEGRIERVVTSHRDPSKADLLRRLPALGPGGDHFTFGTPQVLATGERHHMTEITDTDLVGSSRSAEHLAMLRALGPRSSLGVPLAAHGRTRGVLLLIMTDSGRRFGEDRIVLAKEFATRVALATENAWAYAAERAARADAEAANEVKMQFLATMSHELRTPLTAILGYEELLADGVSGPVTALQHQQLERIRVSALHLLGLINELLSFSRLEAGQETVHREPVELRSVLEEAADIIEPLARPKGLSLMMEPPEPPVVIHTDRGKVRQMLVNLLSNAVKFTSQGGITLSARADASYAYLTVRDTGVGIAPEKMEDIFAPFTQVESALTRSAGGTGLGLSVTRRLAQMLGGAVAVESVVGQGSAFTIRLPRDSEACGGANGVDPHLLEPSM